MVRPWQLSAEEYVAHELDQPRHAALPQPQVAARSSRVLRVPFVHVGSVGRPETPRRCAADAHPADHSRRWGSAAPPNGHCTSSERDPGNRPRACLSDAAVGHQLDAVPCGDQAEQPAAVVHHRDGVGAGDQHGAGYRGEVVVAAGLRPGSSAHQAPEGTWCASKGPGGQRSASSRSSSTPTGCS